MRREFIVGLAATAAWPLVARAQQPRGRLAHIAFLSLGSPARTDSRQLNAFKEGLRDNGLIEGSNITVDYIWAEGRLDRLPELADDLAKRNLDVIVTGG